MGPEKLDVLLPGIIERMLCISTVARAGHKNLPTQRCHVKWLEPSLHEGCFPCVACRAGGSRGHGAVLNTASNQGRKRADGTW